MSIRNKIRFLIAALAASLMLGVTAPPASAAPPEREVIEEDMQMDLSFLCGLEPGTIIFSSEGTIAVTTFFDKDGAVDRLKLQYSLRQAIVGPSGQIDIWIAGPDILTEFDGEFASGAAIGHNHVRFADGSVEKLLAGRGTTIYFDGQIIEGTADNPNTIGFEELLAGICELA